MKKLITITFAILLFACKKEQASIKATATVENYSNFWVVKVRFDTPINKQGIVRFEWKLNNTDVKYFGAAEFPQNGETEIFYKSDIAAYKGETAKVVYLKGKSLDNELNVIIK